MNWTNIQANAMFDLTIDDMTAAVEKLGPPWRASIRVHPLSRGLLEERLRAAFPEGDEAIVAIPLEEGGMAPLKRMTTLISPLGRIPIIEDEFMGLESALVIKEVYQRDKFGVEGWQCEGMQLVKLINEEEDQSVAARLVEKKESNGS